MYHLFENNRSNQEGTFSNLTRPNTLVFSVCTFLSVCHSSLSVLASAALNMVQDENLQHC